MALIIDKISEYQNQMSGTKTVEETFAIMKGLMEQIQEGSLTFFEDKSKFSLVIKLSDFNALSFDAAMYDKIILPFQITVENNTFMKTNIHRLVSRKMPNTINQTSNISNPFSVEIGEKRSFIINLMIDDWDDVNWLIDNDLAFVLYSDNTTLSEIDFAIRMPDIRGVQGYFNFGDNTYDLDDWYIKGLMDFEEILLLPFKLDKLPSLYSTLKSYGDYSDYLDSTYGKNALDAVLKKIQEADSFKDSESMALGMPRDFVYNLLNLSKIKPFRDKFKFNVFRTKYYDGIIDSKFKLSYEEAKEVFENQKDDNAQLFEYNLIHTTEQEQKDNLDMLSFMLRVPFFGSSFVYYDVVFNVLNIRDTTTYQMFESIGKFIGTFIDVQGIMNPTPIIDNIGLQYDVSSQVLENLTVLETIRSTNYVEKMDSTSEMGYEILGVSTDISFNDIINASDITISYYKNPIRASSRNWVVYEHSLEFVEKMLAYNQYEYFNIDETDMFPEDNSFMLYKVDYTIQMHTRYNDDNTFTTDATTQIISNNISMSLGNEIKESFRVISMENVSDGGSSLLLTDPNKNVRIQVIDKIKIFNDGNQFLNISNITIFKPNSKYPFWNEQENSAISTEILKTTAINDDCDFYNSFFDSSSPVAVASFNTLTPGEIGYIYIIINLNRKMMDTYLSTYFSIPIYLRIEFNGSLSLYSKNCSMSQIREFLYARGYDKYFFNYSFNSLTKQHPYSQELAGERTFIPPEPQLTYFQQIYDDGTCIQKSRLQRDMAILSKSTVKRNRGGMRNKVYMGNDKITDIQSQYKDLDSYRPMNGLGISANGIYTSFSQPFIMPIPKTVEQTGISNISDLIDLYQYTDAKDINYKIYFMQFEYFIFNMIRDIKNKYKLVSISSSGDTFTTYLRYSVTNKNEYEQYNSEFYPSSNLLKPIDLSWVQKISASLVIYIPETQINQFQFQMPKTLKGENTADPEVQGMMDMLMEGKTGMDDLKNMEIANKLTAGTKMKTFQEKFVSCIDMGEIVGNKTLTMSILSDYYQWMKIKSYDNLEIKTMSIGPELADTFSLRIMNPTLEYANMIFTFFRHDYTFDMTQEHKYEEDMLSNIGNYIITPPYFDLGYIPIDETYVVMSTIKNQSAFTVEMGMILMDAEARNAIKLMTFPDNEDYDKLYNHFVNSRKYKLRPNEEVKLFLRIIPRRIGLSFYTFYLKFNNSIRPISVEFKSFVNNKAYFVLDEDSKSVDFGDVPIGRYIEESVVVKNIGNIMGKINSIYLFGNDAKYFKLLDRDHGNEISERLSYNKVVRPKTSLAIPMRFYSQSYGFNYSYCYIETNEPVLEDAQYIENHQMVQEWKNAPKYLCTLLKANSFLEGEAIETDSYIFLGYVNPVKSAYRSFEIEVRNKSRSNIISIFKITNLMKNYVKAKFMKEPFTKSTSVWLQLNPRAYTEGQYYDELFIWMIVYDKVRREKKLVLNKISLSQYVTREQRLSFDVDLADILFVAKPFMKGTKRINIRNYSNDDCTMFTNLLTDHSGLFTIVPDLNNLDTLIPEGANFTFLLTFGGDQRFIGKYQTSFTIQMNLGGEVITKIVPITGIVGDENYIKFYKRKQILILD